MNFLLVPFIGFLFVFSAYTQSFESEGVRYEVKSDAYAIDEQIVKRMEFSSQSLRTQAFDAKQAADVSDTFIQKLANFQIYQTPSAEAIASSSSQKTSSTSSPVSQSNNPELEPFKKQIVINQFSGQYGVVHHILLKYKSAELLSQILNQYNNIQLLNTFPQFNLAVLTAKTGSQITTIDLYIQLQEIKKNGGLLGVEAISLDILENPETKN